MLGYAMLDCSHQLLLLQQTCLGRCSSQLHQPAQVSGGGQVPHDARHHLALSGVERVPHLNTSSYQPGKPRWGEGTQQVLHGVSHEGFHQARIPQLRRTQGPGRRYHIAGGGW